MKKIYYTLFLSVALLAVGCTEDTTNDLLENGTTTGENGSEIEGETIRFELDMEKPDDQTRTLLSGVDVAWQEGDCISVNNELYTVKITDGVPAIDVAVAADGVYEAYYPGNCFNGGGLVEYFRQTPMQFYSQGSFGRDANPMYASVTLSDTSKEPKMSFSSLCGVLMLTIKGSATIESIYVEDRAGENVAGDFKIDKAAKKFELYTSRVCRKGVVLNCLDTNGDGVQLSESGTTFFIVMPARNYASGLNIRISDTKHRCMTLASQTPRNIERNKILITPAITYTPNPNKIFEEHFDLMVWGGDIVGGNKGNMRGYTPTGTNAMAPKTVTGFERTLYDATYDTAGSAYFSGDYQKMTTDSHQMSETYLKSRGMWTSPWLFRVQERPGYIGVGTHSTSARGRYRTAPFTNQDKGCQASVEFKIAMMENMSTVIDVTFRDAGFIKEVYLDGKKITTNKDNTGYYRRGNFNNGHNPVTLGLEYSFHNLDYTQFTIPAAKTDEKKWHTLKFIVNDVRSNSSMDLYAASTSGSVGYYIDDVVVTKVKDYTKTLRVLYWNIQQGMWADQHNGYKNFIAWVKKINPDVCIWAEARTNYKNNSEASIETADISSYCKNNNLLLAADGNLNYDDIVTKDYGHTSWTFGAYQDNFPVVMTAKTAISRQQRLGAWSKGTGSETKNKNVSHGGFHAKLSSEASSTNGVNFVGLHLWPQAYGYGVEGTAARETSAAKKEGEAYRLSEMQWIINKTKNNATYKDQPNWLMCGDFNAKSPLDEWYYTSLTTPQIHDYRVHNWILKNTNYCDVIQTIYGNKKMANSRIDFVYVSPAMMNRVIRSYVIWEEDEMTQKKKLDNFTYFIKYSDHSPIFVEFDMSN